MRPWVFKVQNNKQICLTTGPWSKLGNRKFILDR